MFDSLTNCARSITGNILVHFTIVAQKNIYESEPLLFCTEAATYFDLVLLMAEKPFLRSCFSYVTVNTRCLCLHKVLIITYFPLGGRKMEILRNKAFYS